MIYYYSVELKSIKSLYFGSEKDDINYSTILPHRKNDIEVRSLETAQAIQIQLKVASVPLRFQSFCGLSKVI
jgi:hypothetical protein